MYLRTINRLILLYKNEGKQCFIHKNRGRPPVTKINDDIKYEVTDHYINKYSNVNIAYFTEILAKDKDIFVSIKTIRKWLFKSDVISPKAYRNTKKKLKRKIKDNLNKTKSLKNLMFLK